MGGGGDGVIAEGGGDGSGGLAVAGGSTRACEGACPPPVGGTAVPVVFVD